MNLINSSNRLLIYIPAYNCESRILGVVDDIPPEIWAISDVLVVDNHSRDNTLKLVIEANQAKRWPKAIHIVQPKKNLGYAGSQKLAYRLMLEHSQFDAVMMLHGDGQYDSALLPKFAAELDSDAEVVYGYRSWINYWSKDETPISSYITIKSLSFIESLMTGYWRKEWHSGMVMYKRSFLTRVNLDQITKTMHIDGHLLFAAGELKAQTKPLPIYKRYKNYPAIGKTARIRYTLGVLTLIPRLHFIPVARNTTLALPAIPSFDIYHTLESEI